MKTKMKKHALLVSFHLSIMSITLGAEIEKSGRFALVAEQRDEMLRREFIMVVGPLEKFSLIMFDPEGGEFATALLEEAADKGVSYQIIYWRRGFAKQDIVVTELKKDGFDALMKASNELFSNPSDPSVSEKDIEFPLRRLFFQRYKNVDVFCWNAISIRSDCKDPRYKVMLEIMTPAEIRTDGKEFEEFIGPDGKEDKQAPK